MNEKDRDWFRPLWRRVAITAFVALWFLWELLLNKDITWATMVGAALGYAIWSFFISFRDKKKEPGDDART